MLIYKRDGASEGAGVEAGASGCSWNKLRNVCRGLNGWKRVLSPIGVVRDHLGRGSRHAEHGLSPVLLCDWRYALNGIRAGRVLHQSSKITLYDASRTSTTFLLAGYRLPISSDIQDRLAVLMRMAVLYTDQVNDRKSSDRAWRQINTLKLVTPAVSILHGDLRLPNGR